MKTEKQALFIYTKRLILNGFYALFKYMGMNRNTLDILCYHGIEEEGNFYSVDIREFGKQIEKMRKIARFISAEEALRVLGGRQVKEREICLTIDDGYANVMNILPITKKYKIPVLLFVLSNPKDADRKELDHNGRLLTFKEIKHLYSQGWTIGCHSATHVDFNTLNKKQLKQEIIYAKKNLEKKLGFKIEYFAYPKGIYNDQIIDAVKKAGYKAAFAVKEGSLSLKTDQFTIPRTVINKTHGLSDFPALFSPTTYAARKVLNYFNIWHLFMGENTKYESN